MNHFRRLTGLALMLMTMAALSVSAFAMEYSIETEDNTEYYPSTSYEVMYGAAYNYGGSNLVDYQIPELPYGVSSTTQIGIMEKNYLPGLQQNAGTSISSENGPSGGSMISPLALYPQSNRACRPTPALTAWSVRMAVSAR